jgi:hypothetical protein
MKVVVIDDILLFLCVFISQQDVALKSTKKFYSGAIGLILQHHWSIAAFSINDHSSLSSLSVHKTITKKQKAMNTDCSVHFRIYSK